MIRRIFTKFYGNSSFGPNIGTTDRRAALPANFGICRAALQASWLSVSLTKDVPICLLVVLTCFVSLCQTAFDVYTALSSLWTQLAGLQSLHFYRNRSVCPLHGVSVGARWHVAVDAADRRARSGSSGGRWRSTPIRCADIMVHLVGDSSCLGAWLYGGWMEIFLWASWIRLICV